MSEPGQPSETSSASPDPDSAKIQRRREVETWKRIVAEYQTPHRGRAAWQLVNTFGSYVALWYVMFLSLRVSWWLTVPLALLAGGLLVRIFIVFHDCGHGSFFL
jgi:acyl-lipid omega-6 desaturase (Delta-12 desaturase)